jgi:hypothetical protein
MARFSPTEFAARASFVCSAQPSPTWCSPAQRLFRCCQLSSSSAQRRGSVQPRSQLELAQFAQLNLVQPRAAQVSGSSIAVSSAPAHLCDAVQSDRVAVRTWISPIAADSTMAAISPRAAISPIAADSLIAASSPFTSKSAFAAISPIAASRGATRTLQDSVGQIVDMVAPVRSSETVRG